MKFRFYAEKKNANLSNKNDSVKLLFKKIPIMLRFKKKKTFSKIRSSFDPVKNQSISLSLKISIPSNYVSFRNV